MNKIKLLFFLPNFNMGGAEKVTLNIIRELDSSSLEVHIAVLSAEGPLRGLVPKNATVHKLSASKVLLSVFQLRQLIKEIAPAMVYSTLFRMHIALDRALSSMKQKPFVILRNPTSPRLILAEKKLGIIEKFFLIKAYNNATVVIAQTPEMKEELVEYFHVKEQKVNILMNPLDIASIKSGVKGIVNPFQAEKINVVAMGRLGKEKALDVLLKAFKLVVQENSQYMLHIIGRDVGEKRNLIKLCQALHLGENVKFWDEQANPYQFYYFSDLYVLSSLREGLPNTILENLYMKKPIIATKCIPFMSQLIKNGTNGFLVEVGDVKQLSDRILRYQELNVEEYDALATQVDVKKFFLKVLELS